MDTPIVSAREFVSSIELPEPPPLARAATPSGMPDQVAFESGKDQALVVGSDLVSFAGNVPAEQRGDVANALLLAQLRARKVVPQPATIKDLSRWYREYLDVLSQIGFAVQGATMKKYETKTDGFEAHQAVLEVVATLVAGVPGALALVSSTLGALQKMDADNPWITLFNRESRSANTAHFQVSTVGVDSGGDVFVALAAFGLEAKSNVTQVLFFKFRKNEVAIEQLSNKASINTAVLGGVRKDIAKKLVDFATSFIGNLEI